MIRRHVSERSNEFLIYGICGVAFAWHMYYAATSAVPRSLHANVHLGLLLVVFYLSRLEFHDGRPKRGLRNVEVVVFLVAAATTTAYVHLNFWRWMDEGRSLLLYSDLDLVVGFAIIVVVIHATWRAYGAALPMISLVAIGYGFAGPYLPGLFRHSGLSIEDLVVMNTITIQGVYGFILQIGSTDIAMFIIFAGIVEGHGGLRQMVFWSQKAGRYVKSGTVQVAVITSAIMGSITGAAVANIATTGSFTIPIMKDQGVDEEVAAAIESIASTGGQILPPVMGAAAFLMVDMTGTPYREIILSALIPALMFYFSVFVVVHLTALKKGWAVPGSDGASRTMTTTRVDPDSSDSIDAILKVAPHLVALFALIYLLVFAREVPFVAGMKTILLILGLTLLRSVVVAARSTEEPSGGHSVAIPGGRSLASWTRRTGDGVRTGVQNMSALTGALASLGIAVQILQRTGLTQKLAFGLLAVAGGSFILLLVLAAATSLLFGMGLPTSAAYLIVALLTAPALVEFGVPILVAHLFVLFFAVLSSITPPMALACAVASSIAESSFLKTCLETVRLGLFAFVIPFVFVANTELVMFDHPDTVITAVFVFIGLVALAIALTGFDFTKDIRYSRAFFAAIAIALIMVDIMIVKLLSVGVFGLVLLREPIHSLLSGSRTTRLE